MLTALLAALAAVTHLLLAPALSAAVLTPAGSFDWPLTGSHTVVRGFEPPAHGWSAGHRGVDVLGGAGQPVLAAGPGVVTFSGMVAGRGVITVRHPDGRRTTYEPVEARIAVGTTVATGSPVGALSAGGSHCTPRICLHWGLLVGPDEYRDPLSLLALREIVLLPP